MAGAQRRPRRSVVTTTTAYRAGSRPGLWNIVGRSSVSARESPVPRRWSSRRARNSTVPSSTQSCWWTTRSRWPVSNATRAPGRQRDLDDAEGRRDAARGDAPPLVARARVAPDLLVGAGARAGSPAVSAPPKSEASGTPSADGDAVEHGRRRAALGPLDQRERRAADAGGRCERVERQPLLRPERADTRADAFVDPRRIHFVGENLYQTGEARAQPRSRSSASEAMYATPAIAPSWT